MTTTIADERLGEEGAELVQGVVLALRTCRYYGADHPTTGQLLERLRGCLAHLEGAGVTEAVIHLVGYAVFFNGQLLHLRGPQVVVSGVLRELLERVDAGGIRFSGVPTVDGLRAFLDRFWRAEGGRLSRDEIGGDGIALERRRFQKAVETEAVDETQSSLAAYAQLLADTEQLVERPASDLDPRRLRRSVTDLVDSLQSDPDRVLGLLSMRTLRKDKASHPVNTSVLSLRLGHAVGLARGPLADLGMVSLLHEFPAKDCADGSGAALARARSTLALRASYATKRLASVVAYERDMPVQGSREYLTPDRAPHPASRIAAISDAYEAFTAGSASQRPMAPDVALKAMMAQMGRRFDPTLLKLFVNALGLFPVGTPVRLTDGRAAVVVGSPAGAPVSRPRVHVVSGRGEGTVLDLAQEANRGLAIAHAVDPGELPINVTHLFTL